MFVCNKLYDMMVCELVIVIGLIKLGSEKFNGVINYFVMKVNEENVLLVMVFVL